LVKTIALKSGSRMPALGMGTWLIGERPSARTRELDALRLGVDLGATLIDTAEMYGDGAAEKLIGDAIEGRRADVYLVSKVYPHNASKAGVRAACERSLMRLKTDYLDLYLLHWPGTIALSETVAGFQSLKTAGLIRDYGISNFDTDEMKAAQSVKGVDGVVVNQVLYNLGQRGIEWDLLPYCREHEIAIMAYSPLENSGRDQMAILENPAAVAIAKRHGGTAAQVALAWLLHQGVSVIPKAGNPEHVRENCGALDLRLTPDDLQELDRAFPKPDRKTPLAVR
jgi:diketogulonate reductase-like aldo/keto reductase